MKKKNKLKIGLIGGSGFIGSNFIQQFSSKNEILVIGRKTIQQLQIEDKNIPYITTDYSINSLTQALQDLDAVVHLAAIRPKGKNNDHLDHYLQNISLIYNVLEASRNNNITNIVFTSSISVYGSKNQIPFIETINCAPDSAYGLSKILSEQICKQFSLKYDLKIKILRFSQIIGIGEHKNKLSSILISRASNNQPMQIINGGVLSRDYIYIKDVCSAINKSILLKDITGIFNIGMGKSISIADLVNLFHKQFENTSKIILVDRPDLKKNSSLNTSIDNQKAKNELKWGPLFNYVAMIDDIKEVKENRNKG